MAEHFIDRRSPVALALVICFVFAISLTMTTSVTADNPESMYTSRATSAFVRRNLEARKSGMTPASRSYSHMMMSSGSTVSGRVRRLAGSANCTSNPIICNDAQTYGPNATCCASTGTCVQLQSDKNNCGFCMYVCASVLGCCDGVCTSVMTDNQNCGTCGTVCSNSLCTNGLCGYAG
ncbi:unnamed protein product [Calypogeia fissa]